MIRFVIWRCIYLAMGDLATAMILISEAEIQTTSGNPIGYEQALRDLIYGTIYLYQREYSQAWPYLSLRARLFWAR